MNWRRSIMTSSKPHSLHLVCSAGTPCTSCPTYFMMGRIMSSRSDSSEMSLSWSFSFSRISFRMLMVWSTNSVVSSVRLICPESPKFFRISACRSRKSRQYTAGLSVVPAHILATLRTAMLSHTTKSSRELRYSSILCDGSTVCLPGLACLSDVVNTHTPPSAHRKPVRLVNSQMTSCWLSFRCGRGTTMVILRSAAFVACRFSPMDSSFMGPTYVFQRAYASSHASKLAEVCRSMRRSSVVMAFCCATRPVWHTPVMASSRYTE
mmetsp:Transcript_6277/g.15918  ORF Transcript_6277/g.15918 Transcript_6277/m.15918 type:complete len:265 (-) Transcript_6277:212-1006(-)